MKVGKSKIKRRPATKTVSSQKENFHNLQLCLNLHAGSHQGSHRSHNCLGWRMTQIWQCSYLFLYAGFPSVAPTWDELQCKCGVPWQRKQPCFDVSRPSLRGLSDTKRSTELRCSASPGETWHLSQKVQLSFVSWRWRKVLENLYERSLYEGC